MKCPKCGNKMILSHDNNDTNIHANIYKCSCNPFGFTGYELEKYWEDYQQRLDKVLSKFVKKTSGKRYYYAYDWFQIDYYVKEDKFVLCAYAGDINNINKPNFEEITISINTVESILKDLEELND